MPNNRVDISSKLLKELFLNKNLSTYKIGQVLGCSASTIANRLIEFKIPVKNPAIARMRYQKSDFNGSDVEKAYIVGFRIGDLNVYRVSENSETVVVRCHTTHEEQLEVMTLLFKSYGKITTSKKQENYHINCFLNNSFKFLIPKDSSAWQWVETNDKTSRAFIAGYVDAEGNFIINQSRARFKIDSYDFDILGWFSKWLVKHNIQNKFRQIGTKGANNYMGFSWNKDLWRLNINDADSLEKFINLIMPYFKHKRRINQAKLCLSNIRTRQQNGTI